MCAVKEDLVVTGGKTGWKGGALGWFCEVVGYLDDLS